MILRIMEEYDRKIRIGYLDNFWVQLIRGIYSESGPCAPVVEESRPLPSLPIVALPKSNQPPPDPELYSDKQTNSPMFESNYLFNLS